MEVQDVVETIGFAEFYGISTFLELQTSKLVAKLTPNNCAGVLEQASSLGCRAAAAHALGYLVRHADDVLACGTLSMLPTHLLAAVLSSSSMCVDSEVVVVSAVLQWSRMLDGQDPAADPLHDAIADTRGVQVQETQERFAQVANWLRLAFLSFSELNSRLLNDTAPPDVMNMAIRVKQHGSAVASLTEAPGSPGRRLAVLFPGRIMPGAAEADASGAALSRHAPAMADSGPSTSDSLSALVFPQMAMSRRYSDLRDAVSMPWASQEGARASDGRMSPHSHSSRNPAGPGQRGQHADSLAIPSPVSLVAFPHGKFPGLVSNGSRSFFWSRSTSPALGCSVVQLAVAPAVTLSALRQTGGMAWQVHVDKLVLVKGAASAASQPVIISLVHTPVDPQGSTVFDGSAGSSGGGYASTPPISPIPVYPMPNRMQPYAAPRRFPPAEEAAVGASLALAYGASASDVVVEDGRTLWACTGNGFAAARSMQCLVEATEYERPRTPERPSDASSDDSESVTGIHAGAFAGHRPGAAAAARVLTAEDFAPELLWHNAGAPAAISQGCDATVSIHLVPDAESQQILGGPAYGSRARYAGAAAAASAGNYSPASAWLQSTRGIEVRCSSVLEQPETVEEVCLRPPSSNVHSAHSWSVDAASRLDMGGHSRRQGAVSVDGVPVHASDIDPTTIGEEDIISLLVTIDTHLVETVEITLMPVMPDDPGFARVQTRASVPQLASRFDRADPMLRA
jgi:hypothetical protein